MWPSWPDLNFARTRAHLRGVPTRPGAWSRASPPSSATNGGHNDYKYAGQAMTPAGDGQRNGGGAAITANEGQRRQWNDDVRLSAWRHREPMTAGVTAMLLEHAGLQAGEKVLDVGSGSGRSAIAAAHEVGPLGEVVGADISERLVAVACQRAGAESVTNARFVVADVQTAVVEGARSTLPLASSASCFSTNPWRRSPMSGLRCV